MLAQAVALIHWEISNLLQKLKFYQLFGLGWFSGLCSSCNTPSGCL